MAAVQGVVLTVAASGVTSRLVGMIAVAAALLLLAELIGRDVIWLYRAGASPRARLAVRFTIAALALALLWFTLLLPADRIYQISPVCFCPRSDRIAGPGCCGAGAADLAARRIVASVAGVLFGVLSSPSSANMGYYDLLTGRLTR